MQAKKAKLTLVTPAQLILIGILTTLSLSLCLSSLRYVIYVYVFVYPSLSHTLLFCFGYLFVGYVTLFADMTALTLLRRSVTAVSYDGYAHVCVTNWRFLPQLQRCQLHLHVSGRHAAVLLSSKTTATTATSAVAAAQAPNAYANVGGKFISLIYANSVCTRWFMMLQQIHASKSLNKNRMRDMRA